MLNIQQILNKVFRNEQREPSAEILQLQQIFNYIFDESKNALRISGEGLRSLLKTGQTISYHAGDDGDLEQGITHDYTVLSIGQYAGTTNIVINGKTHALSNNCVKDNNTGLMWARYVPLADIGPATNGKLFWKQWTLAAKTDITFIPFEVVENCEDAWDEWVNANVTSTADADHQVGTYSAKLAVADLAAAGEILATEAIASTDLSGYNKIRLWIKSSVATASGDLQFLLDDTANCASPIESLDIPSLSAGTWTRVELTLAVPASCTAIISVGIKMVVDKSIFDIFIDDIQGFHDKKIVSGAAQFDINALCDNRRFTVTGSANNNNTFNVNGTPTTSELIVDEALIEEAAGVSVSIATVDDLVWDFLAQANANNLGGHNDWRISNYHELPSIVDLGHCNPAIDTTVFPSTPADYHWTASTYPCNSTCAFLVDFYNGFVGHNLKETYKYRVRLVRG